MLKAGLMAEAGLAKLAQAQRDGSWTKLDDVENLSTPDDLAAALAEHPQAAVNFDAFPRSANRGNDQADVYQLVAGRSPWCCG
jgi:uncharacterized protein YdeI (YjbR/CyaY-like superfamily)